MKEPDIKSFEGILNSLDKAKADLLKSIKDAEIKRKREEYAFLWVSVVVSFVTFLIGLIGTLGEKASNLVPAIGWLLSHNFFADIWNASSADGKLQFLGTIVVGIPGLTILKIVFGKSKEK